MIPNLDVDLLKTFLAIADYGSFTRAAEEVHKTQSAVSMQMKRLEEIVASPLFVKDGRMSRFTPDGERLVDYARRIVAMNDEAVSAFTKPELVGTIRFGTPDDYAEKFLPEILARFARTHPLVTVDVECLGSGELFSRVKRSEIDLALVTLRASDGESEVVRTEQLRWVTSSRHNTHNMPVLPLAAADNGCLWRRSAEEGLTRLKKPYRVAYTSSNRAALDAAVLQGLAIAVMPEICVRPGMRVLTEPEGFPALHMFNIGLVMKPAALSQSAQALADHIRDSFGVQAKMMAAE